MSELIFSNSRASKPKSSENNPHRYSKNNENNEIQIDFYKDKSGKLSLEE